MHTTDDKDRGIYNKYRVERLDGSSELGGKHHNCRYYVLDIDHDPNAIPALVAYASACEKDFPLLASDLNRIIAEALYNPQTKEGDQ